MARSSLNQVLRSMQAMGEGNAQFMRACSQSDGATAALAMTHNAIGVMLDLTLAVKAAASGDTKPALSLVRDLRLDEVEIL